MKISKNLKAAKINGVIEYLYARPSENLRQINDVVQELAADEKVIMLNEPDLKKANKKALRLDKLTKLSLEQLASNLQTKVIVL
jgi:long-subunit acyl-CoA synthetase (AMP-forming)